jgi:predicted nucleic acid-binding protein
MALTRKEFDVLSTLATSPDDARARAASSELDELHSMGLVSDNAITELGRKALEPYRVENAVIMAAGLSSRFVPVSYWRPKGLTSVRGEVLIERQIRQLHEAGITDITVVVGYRAEEFAYLAEKYGVRLVTNDLYAERNNNWTLWLVRDQLRNTYICSSDDYFAQNPFRDLRLSRLLFRRLHGWPYGRVVPRRGRDGPHHLRDGWRPRCVGNARPRVL